MGASINISKVLTVITSIGGFGKISTHRLGELETIISSLTSFELFGCTNEPKVNKYLTIIESLGFTKTIISCVNSGFEGKNSDCINFRYSFSK